MTTGENVFQLLDDELSSLLEKTDVSAPSVTKFDNVRRMISDKIQLPVDKVSVYFVSKPGNFDVRFQQPRVVKNSPLVGIALIPEIGSEAELLSYLIPAKRNVQNSTFDIMIIVSRGASHRCETQAVIAKQGTAVDLTIGSIIPISTIEYVTPNKKAILETAAASTNAYNHSDFTRETGLSQEFAEELMSRLMRKGQIVLQGPPGSGKTWIAERLAKLVVGTGSGIADLVQFHPAYGYEDFICGIAPFVEDKSIVYRPKPGRFLDFCEAARDAADPCVLVVDEFNRADISRVFGELMHALEYREKYILLANGPGDGRFAVPDNVFIIATMNTADRSISNMDYALRRRFSFFRIQPNYAVLSAHLLKSGLNPVPLVDTLQEINDAIDDEDYSIGISFFMGHDAELTNLIESIWNGEVFPYLTDILQDRPELLTKFGWSDLRKKLLNFSLPPLPTSETN